MKLSKQKFLIAVRIAVFATIVLLITNAIFVLTNEPIYMFISMLSSTIALIFAIIMECSEHKYTWKEVFLKEQNEK